MPTISMFYGIIINMYNNGEHNPPHFHATYQDYKAIFNFDGENRMKKVYDAKLKDYVCIADEELLTVTDVKASCNFSLLLTFSNGEKRLYDAKPLLKEKLYQDLRNPNLFLQAKALYGTVVWNDNLDIAPEYLYEQSIPT